MTVTQRLLPPLRSAPVGEGSGAGRLTDEGIERLRAGVERHVGDTLIPGVVALAATADQVHVEAAGHLALGGAPVTRRSLFRIASTTKPVTAVATLALAGEGLVDIDEPVLGAEAVRAMTSDQLTKEQKAHGGLGPDFFVGRSWGFGQTVLDSGAYGWDGGLGTSWLVDPTRDLCVVALTQRMWETSTPPPVHGDVQAAAYAALA